VTRENTIFAWVGLFFNWGLGGSLRLKGLIKRLSVSRILLACLPLVFATAALSLESYRKSLVLGDFGNPTMKASYLYHTPVFDLGWYFIYDFPGMKIDPVQYFLSHPGELFDKIGFQLGVIFLHQTVPSLLAFAPYFIPLLFPPLLPD